MNDGTVVLWEVASAKERRVFGKKPAPANNARPMNFVSTIGTTGPAGDKIAFAPDGRQLVHAGYDHIVHIWDVVTGAEVAALAGHTGTINAVAFAPDGKTLASASNDTTALIWDFRALQPKAQAPHAWTAKEQEERWQGLKDADAHKAFTAICELTAAPTETVAFLKNQLQPAPAIDLGLVKKLIADLDDAAYKVRQKAATELLKVGERAVPLIHKTLAADPPLEVKKRLEDIHDKLTNTVLTDEKLRHYRAVEVLERIGTPEARHMLEILADGAPGAFVTTTAQAAVSRLRLSTPR
jgi:hypothetical protein